MEKKRTQICGSSPKYYIYMDGNQVKSIYTAFFHSSFTLYTRPWYSGVRNNVRWISKSCKQTLWVNRNVQLKCRAVISSTARRKTRRIMYVRQTRERKKEKTPLVQDTHESWLTRSLSLALALASPLVVLHPSSLGVSASSTYMSQ